MSHSKKKDKCCPDYYKKCYTKNDALRDFECKVKELVNCDYLTGISAGIICEGEIIYNKGCGVRNAAGDPFTNMTFAQLADSSLLFVSIFLSNLAELNIICPNSRILPLGFSPANNRAFNFSSQITDVLGGDMGYTVGNLVLSCLLCHDPEEILRLLAIRVFTRAFNKNLVRNQNREFFGAFNNCLIQPLLNIIAESKLGGGKFFEKIREFLQNNNFTNFGWGTQAYIDEPNHTDGCLRRDCCWEDTTLPQNVDGYEASFGAYSNTTGLLNLTKLILNGGISNGMQVLNKEALRKYFRQTKTRVNVFDNYCDTKDFPIPEINVTGGGLYKMCICGADFYFYSGMTESGVRSLIAMDYEHKFGISILARCKTVFPEALMGYAWGLVVLRDKCKAEKLMNFLYRLFNPYLELQLPNIKIEIPKTDNWKFRKRAAPLPIAGRKFNSGHGSMVISEENGQLFAVFGNCPDKIKLCRVGLDNYAYLWVSRSGYKYAGQIQFTSSPDGQNVGAFANMFRDTNITFEELSLEDILPSIELCNTTCIPLPPLEEDNDCCYYDKCGRKKCRNPKKCCRSNSSYCSDSDSDNCCSSDSEDSCDDKCRNPCKPIRYNLIEESDICIKKYKKPRYLECGTGDCYDSDYDETCLNCNEHYKCNKHCNKYDNDI